MTTDPDPWADLDRRPEALSRLTSGGGPPPDLEDRVVRTLRERGLLGARRPSGLWRSALPVAAALTGLAMGFALGRRPEPATSVATPRFALLLYEDSAFQAPPPGDKTRYVAEYGRWAASLSASGTAVTGEELGGSGRLVQPGGETVDRDGAEEGRSVLAGFFIVTAPDLARATAIAKTCPHLKHGGRVVIRPIEPT